MRLDLGPDGTRRLTHAHGAWWALLGDGLVLCARRVFGHGYTVTVDQCATPEEFEERRARLVPALARRENVASFKPPSGHETTWTAYDIEVARVAREVLDEARAPAGAKPRPLTPGEQATLRAFGRRLQPEPAEVPCGGASVEAAREVVLTFKGKPIVPYRGSRVGPRVPVARGRFSDGRVSFRMRECGRSMATVLGRIGDAVARGVVLEALADAEGPEVPALRGAIERAVPGTCVVEYDCAYTRGEVPEGLATLAHATEGHSGWCPKLRVVGWRAESAIGDRGTWIEGRLT